jgi:uncharacterized protein (TIGR03435 family)
MKILWMAVLCLVSASLQAGSNGGPNVGEVPPLLGASLLLQAPPGTRMDAAFLSGSVVVLEFWATWCGPCVAAIPHLNELADQFKDKRVRFIAITAEDEATVTPFLKKRPIDAWIALDTNRAMNKAFAVASIPHTVVLNKDGKIAAITYSSELTAQHLTDLLNGRKISLSDARVEEVPAPKSNNKPALFEMTVRPSNSTNSHQGIGWGNGNFNAPACTVWRTLPMAFDTTFSRIITNSPLPPGLFDFKITEPRSSEKEMPVLLQTALRITFGLTGKKEIRQTSVFLLKVITPAATGRTASPTKEKSFRFGGGQISGVGVSMKQLASALEQSLKQPVIDETGSKEDFDIELRWKESKSDTANREALLTAVREQLGLELVPAVRPVEMVIVEQTQADSGQTVLDRK